MAMGCEALGRGCVCVTLVTRHPDSGELGTVFNPFFDVQIWDAWQAHPKYQVGKRPYVRIVDMPFDRPEGPVAGLCVQIIGQLVAEVLEYGAPDVSSSVLRIELPARETWPALSRASHNDSRLPPVERARRWRDIPAWRRVARRPRTLPAAICSQISRRVLGTVGPDGDVTPVWFSVA